MARPVLASTSPEPPVTRTVTYTVNDVVAMAARVNDIIATYDDYTVTDAESCLVASTFLTGIQKARRWIDGVYKAARAPLNAALKGLSAEADASLEPLAEAESTVTVRIQNWRKADAEQRRAADDARRRLAEEQALADQQAKASQLRAVAVGKPIPVAAALIAQADAVAGATVLIPPLDPTPEPVTLAAGQFDRSTWRATVEDPKKLLLSIAAQIMLTEHGGSQNATVKAFLEIFKPSAQASALCMEPATAELDRLATAFRQDLRIPGVVASEKTTLVGR